MVYPKSTWFLHTIATSLEMSRKKSKQCYPLLGAGRCHCLCLVSSVPFSTFTKWFVSFPSSQTKEKGSLSSVFVLWVWLYGERKKSWEQQWGKTHPGWWSSKTRGGSAGPSSLMAQQSTFPEAPWGWGRWLSWSRASASTGKPGVEIHSDSASTGGTERQTTEAHWPANLDSSMGFRVIERLTK